jgi:hypothetical protein
LTVLRKARFWQNVRDVSINDRQRMMLNRLLDGFEGKLTTSKWSAMAKCSSDTALRDILDLVGRPRAKSRSRTQHQLLAAEGWRMNAVPARHSNTRIELKRSSIRGSTILAPNSGKF